MSFWSFFQLSGLWSGGKNRPVDAASGLVAIVLPTCPADFVVKPLGDVQINLAVQAVPELVEEK